MVNEHFPIHEAELVALFMECIFYGIFLVTLAQSFRALFWDATGKHFKRHVDRKMSTVTLALSIFATLDVSIGLYHILDAFVYYKGGTAPLEVLQDVSSWAKVMKSANYVAQVCIGDSILIYRLWVVYARNWLIIIPNLLCWLAGLICGVVDIALVSNLNRETTIHDNTLAPYSQAFTATTVINNVLATSLIVWRIWSVNRHASNGTRIQRRSSSKLSEIIAILIESAALYTISVLIFLGTFISGSNADAGVSDCIVQIVGIAFNLIIIRVNSGESFQPSTGIEVFSEFKAASPNSTTNDSTTVVSSRSVNMNIENGL